VFRPIPPSPTSHCSGGYFLKLRAWLARAGAAACLLLLAGSLARGGALDIAGTPAPDDLNVVYGAANAYFEHGDYGKAAPMFEKVIAEAGPDGKLENLYYNLGACYFNLTQFDKAAETLRKYLDMFPKGSRVAEATFSLGQACLLTHDNAHAAEAFKALETNGNYRERALLFEGMAQKDGGQTDAAIGTLEKLVGKDIHGNDSVNGALLLAGLYAEKKQATKAVALIKQIRLHIDLLDNVLQLNTLATQTGDLLLAQKQSTDALECYRVVRSHDELLKLQTDRIASLQWDMLRDIAGVRADPKNAAALLVEVNRVRGTLAQAIQSLADIKKAPDFGPTLLIRLATCFKQLNLPWEAIVAYDELRARFPDDPTTREPALYALITTSADVGRFVKAKELAEKYLDVFKQGPNANAVGYLLGAMAMQANDPKEAETYFGRMLKTQTGSPYKEAMRFQLGNVQFAQGEYDTAQATYANYIGDYPNGQYKEEAVYRTALCGVFGGQYEKAMGLLNNYLKEYPQGDFVPDAGYRLAVCLYAASQYDQVIAACKAWEKAHPNDPMLGEVLALEADSYAANNNDAPATELYLRSSKVATTDEVSDYSIFAAQKLLQKAGDWEQIGKIMQDFVHDHPDRPSAVMGVYWIGKADTHLGKVDEAKHFIANTIKKYMADPKRDAVEQLLTQLATICMRKTPPPVPVDTPAASPDASPGAVVAGATPSPSPSPAGADLALASPSPAPDATPTPAPDGGAEMDLLLGGAETESSALARARVLFAKSELARLRRQPAAQDQYLMDIATKFQPEQLDPTLLGLVGDTLIDKGKYDQAAPFYETLKDAYPKSDQLEYAYNGLGEIAFQKKNYPLALRYFNDAIDKAGASVKLKDVTIGKAKTLQALKRYDEAKPLYEQVASTREWRGESTAMAVYSLGEIMRAQGKLPEAIAYYQRVFVAYQRYLPWVAKAYIASAQCFEQLGKKQEARNTYQEMLNNPKLQSFEEAQLARAGLMKMGPG
jgi:TolA-binding protein